MKLHLDMLHNGNLVCSSGKVYYWDKKEPQFNPDIINAVAKDMKIKTGVVDPLGATLDPGKDLYFNLIRNMSASFKGC